MTNKPMLSVERELIRRVTSQALGMSAKKDRAYAAHELRAILEKTECIKCKDTGEVDSGGVQPWGEGINITCDCVLDAKQQSAPMAWVIQWGSVIPGCRGHREVVLKDPGDLDAVITPLYAEQPAPVSDHPQCEECKGWGYHENHHEGGGTECGECGGSGNATVAEVMVMPDRMKVEPFTTIDRGSKNYKAGYNAAIAEVAKLNGLKT